MDEKLYKELTGTKYIDHSAKYEKQSLKVSPFLMPLPRAKAVTLYILIYLSIILSSVIVFYFNNTDVAAGVLIFCLAMILVVRKVFCDKHYLNVLFENHTLVVNDDDLEIPAILTESRQAMKVDKRKIKQIILPWNIWYYSTVNSSQRYKTYVLFSIVIELHNHTKIHIPPNCVDRKALICQLVRKGYELSADHVETKPVKDFQNIFLNPMKVIFSCLTVYGIYSLFEL